MIGRVLNGRYRVTETLGAGGMASVYGGVREADGGEVAIKVLRPEHEGDREFVWRFHREAKMVAALRSPHTVRVFDFGVDGADAYMVMERVRGEDLLDLLCREQRVPEARAARIIIQVCEALTEAHRLTIVHRDLKPDNVMLLEDATDAGRDFVKILDFGIAKILDVEALRRARAAQGQSDTDLGQWSQVSSRLGTPQYMSPEQGRNEPVDARTDIYGCGVMLYELLTGGPPFDGERPLVILLAHVNQPPTPPSALLPVHRGLEEITLRALSKRPDRRQPSADALAAELASVLPELAVTLRHGPGEGEDTLEDDPDGQTIPFRRL